MPLIFTGGGLAELFDYGGLATGPVTDAPWVDWNYLSGSYARIYRTQPNVRTVVDFVARNIAQLGVHVYEKVSHDDRRRVTDHPVLATLSDPAPSGDERMTTHELIDTILHDYLIYDRAYLLKLRDGDTVKLRRLSPRWTVPVGANGMFNQPPQAFRYRDGAVIPAEQVVVIRGYDPDGWIGVSPMETLRMDLELDLQGQMSQLQLYRNGSRIRGWLERPLEAPEWSDEKRTRFRDHWRAQWTGDGPEAMGTPVLEDGMKFHADGFSPEQTKYLEERRLTMERACAAYFIHPTMLGIDQGTYANTREFHKMLYQDSLGPTIDKVEQRFNQSLLSEWPDAADFYVELNVAEKLRGDFEEQATVLQKSVGRPWMSANEGRRVMNLPRIDTTEADALVVPLNVLVGGQPSPPSPTPAPPSDQAARRAQAKARADATVAQQRTRFAQALAGLFEQQRRTVVGAMKSMPPLHDAWDQHQRDDELSALLLQHGYGIAKTGARQVLDEWDPEYEWDDEPMLSYLTPTTSRAAGDINAATYAQLVAAVASGDDWRGAVNGVFDQLVGSRADEIAATQTTGAQSFGRHEAARAVGLSNKTWTVGASNPRPTHAALDGETVGVDDTFSNGARWPGDGILPPEERVNCSCNLEFSRGE